jgi:hypothetical protein
MIWEELYPIVKNQADWAVLRYEEPERRKDKIQELVCQSYQKYLHDIERGIEPQKNNYKSFVTKRAKEVDIRSICKNGTGGTSSIDVLSYVNRRATAPITVVEFDNWMTVTPRTKENIEAAYCFPIDYEHWLAQLDELQQQILNYLIQGYKISKIAEIIKATISKVKKVIREIQKLFVGFFDISLQCA